MRRGGVMQKTSLPSMWQRSLPCPSPCIPMGVSDRKWLMVRLGVSGRKWFMVRLGVSGRKWLMVRLSGRRNLYGKDGGSSLLRYSWPLLSLVRRRAVATRGRPPGPPRRRVVAEALRLRRIRIQRSRLRLRPRLTRLARGAPPARAIRHRPPRTTEFKKAMSPSTPVSPSPRRGSLSPPPRWRREMMCLVLLPVLASPFRIILEKNSTSISWSSSCCPRRALSSMPDLPAPITLSSRARSLTAVVRAVMSASIPISPAAVSSWSSTSRSSPRARSVRRGSTISETSDGPGILPQRSRDARDRLD